MILNARKLFTATFIILTLTACGKGPRADYVIDGELDMERVKLTCTNPANCPNGVGVLMRSEQVGDKSYIVRCTAALYAPDKIVTAGHCTENFSSGKFWFRTVESAGRPSRTFAVTKILKKVYSQKKDFYADYAGLQLAESAKGFDLVQPSGATEKNLRIVTAAVINSPTKSYQNLRLDTPECRTGATYAPLSMLLDIVGTESCVLVSGNSGGPLFIPGTLRLLGVLSTSTSDAKDYRQDISTFSNAACFDFDGWPAADKNCRRVTAQNRDELWREWYSANQLKEAAERLQSFFLSDRSRVTIAGAQIQFSGKEVRLSKVSKTGPYVSSDAILPVAACISGGNELGGWSHEFKLELPQIDSNETISLSAKIVYKLWQGWTLNFDPAFLTDYYTLDNEIQQLYASSISLTKCGGSPSSAAK